MTVAVCLALLILAQPIAVVAQSLTSTNPAFTKYYSVIQDAGPTYSFGPNNTPVYSWYIFTDAVADFLGRGAPQILLTGFSSNNSQWVQAPVRLLVNTGNGTFTDGASFIAPSAPAPYFSNAAAVADFNGDRVPDVFIANVGPDVPPFAGETNALLLSAPGGQLRNAAGSVPSTSGYSQTTAAGALNGDNIADILVANGCCGEPTYFLINDGAGNFVKDYSRLPAELQGSAPAIYSAVALVDVNNDGFPDLVLGAETALHMRSKIYLNDGAGSFANSPPVLLPPGCFDGPDSGYTGVLSIKAADLRRTGEQDLILNEVYANGLGYNASCIQILVNDGSGHFTDQTALRGGNVLAAATGSGSWYDQTHVADVNGDGYPDLVVSPGFLRPATPNLVLLNDGHGFFTATALDFFPLYRYADGSYGQNPYMIPVDLNGKGRIGFVQPYYSPGAGGSSTLKFAVYQPVASQPTPSPSGALLVPVTINSSPDGAFVTVSGAGCSPGTYPTPANLLWQANANCTLSFAPLYLRDPRLGGPFIANQRYAFAYADMGDARTPDNPQIVNAGSAPIAINAVYLSTPLAPPAQSAILQFTQGDQAAFSQAASISAGPEFTMEAWIYPTAGGGMIMGKASNYALSLDANGIVTFDQSTGQPGTDKRISAPSPIPLNTWTHVAAVLNSGLLQLYIDGQLVSVFRSSGPPSGRDVPFSVGAGIPDGEDVCCSFMGAISQVRLWSRGLSAAEIQTYATTVVTGGEAGLVAAWPLDDGDGPVARNIVPGGPVLNLLNAPVWTTGN